MIARFNSGGKRQRRRQRRRRRRRQRRRALKAAQAQPKLISSHVGHAALVTVAEGRSKLVKAVELAIRQAKCFREVLALLPRHLRRSIWGRADHLGSSDCDSQRIQVRGVSMGVQGMV